MLTPPPGEGYRPLKDEAELMRDSFAGLIDSLSSTSQGQTVEEVLKQIISLAEGIELAEERDPVFSHHFAEEVMDHLNFFLREGLPKYIDFYRELLDRHEHSLAESEKVPSNTSPVKEKTPPAPGERVEELSNIISEIENIIHVKEVALKGDFGPLLVRAKAIQRRVATHELRNYEDDLGKHAKIPNNVLRKKRIDRSSRLHRRVLTQAAALASHDPEFREMTYNPIMRTVQGIQQRTVEAIRKTMECEAPKAKKSKLPVILLFVLISVLAGGSVAYWNGIRLQDIYRFLRENGIPIPQSSPDDNPESGQKPSGGPTLAPPAFPGSDERQQRQAAISATKSWIDGELNANQLTLGECEQAIGQWTAVPPSADRDVNLREWINHKNLLALLERLHQLLARIERGEEIDPQEIDSLINPERVTEAQLSEMEEAFKRPGIANSPESANGLRKVAQIRKLVRVGERVKRLLQ